MEDILRRDITFLTGVGEHRARVLAKELDIHTWGDLLYHFPYRHIDRTRIYSISEILPDMPYIQLQGEIMGFIEEGTGAKRRLKAYFKDNTGVIELVWFNAKSYILKQLKLHKQYTVFGKPSLYGTTYNIVHPDVEPADKVLSSVGRLYPMYYTTDKMKRSSLTSKVISELQRNALKEIKGKVNETLPEYIVQGYEMLSRGETLEMIHFPTNARMLERARARLKMEELFFLTLRKQYLHNQRKESSKGFRLIPNGQYYQKLRYEGLNFQLTKAQDRVIGEIISDMSSGHQMNRLLQGDVGSGKTIVALLSMLVAIDNGYQACMMAPTEILAQQHYATITKMLRCTTPNIRVALLTGSMTDKDRKPVLKDLASGRINILIGTHILIQEYVTFQNLGIAVIDEQHRFGVFQRSLLWDKNTTCQPHILIMSATPIPRTLAMTVYGDLDVSVINELPPGRTPILTSFVYDRQMHQVYEFIANQLCLGRQCYVVYPLIEESEKSDLMSLEEGYQDFTAAFPHHKVGMVHGKLKADIKEREMQRFASGETSILVATTVIEVGVDVPNASVMVITSAERFGLSQLHQLRGRVGRGSTQSYCILQVSDSINDNSLKRIHIMCESTDGFYLAEEDLKMRGYGDIEGTQQSGEGLSLRIADLTEDGRYVQFCNNLVRHILTEDPLLELPKNSLLQYRLQLLLVNNKDWGLIS